MSAPPPSSHGPTDVPSLEFGLLLACLRARYAKDPDEPTEALDPEIDWTVLVRLALDHGVTPLLHAGLERHADRLPSDLWEALSLYVAENRRTVQELIEFAHDLVERLEERGIATILFKGPALAESAYGDPAARQAGDIDLLLQPESVRAACDLLSALGFREGIGQRTGRSLSAAEWRALLQYQCEAVYTRPQDGVVVEPHWAFAPVHCGIPLRTEDVWRRARTGSVLGGRLRHLAIEDLFLVLSVHASKHEWSELRWVADLDALVRRHPEVDLEAVRVHARGHSCERMLLAGLQLAKTLVGTPLPSAVLTRLDAEPGVQTITRRIAEGMAHESRDVRSVFQLSGVRLGLLDRHRDRLASTVRTLLTPRIEHVRRVPRLSPTSPLQVPVKLGIDYMPGPLWLVAKRVLRRRLAESRRRGGRGLLVLDQMPFLMNGAGFERGRALLGLLADENHAITLHPTLPHGEAESRWLADLPDQVEVVWDRGADRFGEYLDRHRSAFSTLLVRRPRAMREATAALGSNGERRGDLRVVYDSEAIAALRDTRRREVLGDPLGTEDAARLVAAECRLAGQADAVIASCDRDAEVFRGHGVHVPVHVLPHVVSVSGQPASLEARRGLLFVDRVAEDGSAAVDGLIWFLDHVFPTIRDRLEGIYGELVLTIVGVTGSSRLARRRDPGVRYLGGVADLSVPLDEARALVVPHRFPAGVPAAVPQAAARGAPIVASEAVATALGWEVGRELLGPSTADPASFAEAVVELYTDAGLAERLRQDARERVAVEHSPARARTTLRAALRGTPAGRSQPSSATPSAKSPT